MGTMMVRVLTEMERGNEVILNVHDFLVDDDLMRISETDWHTANIYDQLEDSKILHVFEHWFSRPGSPW